MSGAATTMPERGAEYLTVSQSGGGIAHLTMARPPVNAVNQQMYGELRDVFGRIDEFVPEARVLVLSGGGRHFCAGNDLNEFGDMTAQNAAARMRTVREAFAAIYECPVPTIAAVQGAALGTGACLAACCDLIVCGESARFGAPEVGVGVLGAGRHLARIVPEHVMRLMYFTADPVPARNLACYGGITAVVPDNRLLTEAFELAGRIARHSAVVLRSAKESLNRTEFMELRAGYAAEQQMTIGLAGDDESIEARRAALGHRAPRYRHHTS